MSDLAVALQEHRNLRAQLLEAFPELAGDEQALADSLEGISRLDDQIVAALRHAAEREAHADGIKLLLTRLSERKRRLEEGAQRIRLIVLDCMQNAGISRIKAADMSISIGRGKPKVIITEPDKIPDFCCKIVREPSRVAIAAELNAGREVAGATLGNPVPFLSVHRS